MEIKPNLQAEEEIKKKLTEKESNTSSSKGCLISIVTIILIIFIVILMLYLFGRKDTTLDDITINEKKSGITSYSITFIPNKDIDDLVFKFDFYDNNRKYITSIDKSIGTVKKGTQYTTEVYFYDLSITQSWNSEYCSISVKGRTHIISL